MRRRIFLSVAAVAAAALLAAFLLCLGVLDQTAAASLVSAGAKLDVDYILKVAAPEAHEGVTVF